MSKKCDVCGKGPGSGNAISHSHRKTRRRWLPNLRQVKVIQNSVITTSYVCTRCLRSNKVTKA